mgnify:CR=1 FL=1
MRVQVDGMRVPRWVYVCVRGMEAVPLMEIRMHYISGLRDI